MRGLNSALVLGGAGFLGSWLLEALHDRDIEVVVIDDLSTGSTDHLRDTRVIVADAAEVDTARIVREHGVDVVFQLAGTAYVPPSLLRPLEDLQRNTTITLSVLEALRGLTSPPVLAFTSSAAVYGNGLYLPMDEDHPLRPMSPYGVSKLACEHYVRLYADLYELPTFSVRLFSLYGPRQRKQVVHDLLRRCLDEQEEELVVLGRPDVSRDLVFVEDAARALSHLAVAAPARGEAYNIAAGRATTLGELVECLCQATDSTKRVRFTGSVRPGDPLHWKGDAERARALGVTCATPLEEGIGRTVEWFMSRYASVR